MRLPKSAYYNEYSSFPGDLQTEDCQEEWLLSFEKNMEVGSISVWLSSKVPRNLSLSKMNHLIKFDDGQNSPLNCRHDERRRRPAAAAAAAVEKRIYEQRRRVNISPVFEQTDMNYMRFFCSSHRRKFFYMFHGDNVVEQKRNSNTNKKVFHFNSLKNFLIPPEHLFRSFSIFITSDWSKNLLKGISWKRILLVHPKIHLILWVGKWVQWNIIWTDSSSRFPSSTTPEWRDKQCPAKWTKSHCLLSGHTTPGAINPSRIQVNRQEWVDFSGLVT